MQDMKHLSLVVLTGFLMLACGGSKAKEKSIHQSERFYEAASIAWFEEQDTLAAIRNLTRAIESNPDNHDAHYLLGIIRLGRGDLKKAEHHLKETIRLRQGGDPSGLAGAENNMGVVLIHLKRYDEAIAMLEKSAGEVMNREPWLAFGNLGWAYIETGEYDKAIEALKRAMFDQPKYCVGLFRMGQAYYLKKEYEDAESYLTQSLNVPETGCDQLQEAYHLLGMIHLRLDRNEKAKAAFDSCVNIGKLTETGKACVKALESF
jgi:type IV pilus assembly protein PilF